MLKHISVCAIKIFVDDILVIHGDGNYSKILTKDGKSFLSCRTLKYFVKLLEECNFIRPSKSSLINFAAIDHVDLKSQKSIRLINHEVIAISRRNIKPLKVLFSNHP